MNQELERFEPEEGAGRIAYEHLHRYAMCRDRVAGRRVLDVACGAGYGSNILAEVAAEVTGLDIDPGAIRKAAKKYKQGNLRFITADCLDMPFDDGSFDVVVANEMIEHIEEQDAFLSEVRRVLKPGGTLLISTPNKPIYNRYKSANPFHVSEMTIPEFRRLLEGHFRHVYLTGLRMALVSAGFEIGGERRSSNLATAQTYRGVKLHEDRPEVSNDELSLRDPEYVLATCSDQKIEHIATHSTIFFSDEDDLWLEHEKIMAWASQLHGEDELLRADLRRTQAELEDSRKALEKEHRTTDDALTRASSEMVQHLQVSSRLLSRLTGSEVGPEPVALIEAMFSINEQVVTQRARIDALSAVEDRARSLERELEVRRAAHDQLEREVRRTEFRLEELKRDIARARDERDKLTQELSASQEKGKDLSREVTRLSAESREFRTDAEAKSIRLEELKRESAAARDEREKLAQELNDTRSKREDLSREVARLSAEAEEFRAEAEAKSVRLENELKEAQRELAKLKKEEKRQLELKRSDNTASYTTDAGGQDRLKAPDAKMRRRERLTSSHEEVQEQLTGARRQIHNRIPEKISRRRTIFERISGSRRVKRTIIFDPAWIARQIPGEGGITLSEFLKNRKYYRIDPHPLFDARNYLDQYIDVARAGISPLEHYLEHGWREGRNPHRYFANDWYLQQNPDIIDAGINPLEHYLDYGWKEGRQPNPVFDPTAYLARHVDVKAAGVEPLTHFVTQGVPEHREIPFQGLERDWRSLVSDPDAQSLMDHLLSPFTRADSPTGTWADPEDGLWPGRPLNDFWIPQALRDFMMERGWEGMIPLYTYLYSVMDAYAEAPDEFVRSNSCDRMLERAQLLSAHRAVNQSSTVAASVIIPVYNNVLDTLLCVLSLLESEPKISFEIIVADDRSDDGTSWLIPQIAGVVRYLRQPENLGFVNNCNVAAKEAQGNFVILLNNDTLALPGWLDNLIAPFDRIEDVGLVGSKLISWDGRLQEAGGILWKDGSAWNFGRGENPVASEYDYLKDADYCSGAAIAVPRDLWRKLGGFDPIYSPAYCEDADLAFRIRAAALRTIYSPASELIHHEGRSHGRDTAAGIKSYQVTNQQQFFSRWRETLERDHFSNGENVLRARDRSRDKPHILVIDHYVPQVDKDAGSRTMLHFLEILAESGWSITFWPENLYYDPDYTRLIQNIGVEVIYGPKYVGKFSEFLRSRPGLYDAVLLSRPHVAVHFIDDVRTLTDAQILYYGHDVHFERMKAQWQIAQSVDEDAVDAMRSLEVDLCDRCDVILYPSVEEARLMAKLVSRKVRSIAVPAYRFEDEDIAQGDKAIATISPSAGLPAGLLFVGGFSHGPNIDGIVWFCREVAPILRKDGFRFDLKIVGSNPTAEVWDLEGDDTQVLGYVSDDKLRECYCEASIVIAPLRFGAGVKGKVVEAMARGVPVVTTKAGAQGLKNADSYLFLGDNPEEFAAAVRAATDAEIAKSKARLALGYVRTHFSTAAMKEVFLQVLPSASLVSRVQ